MASVAFGYLPILLFLIVALGLSAGFVVLPMIVARLTGAHQPDPVKLSEYECGFPAFDDARARAEAIAEKAGLTLGAPVAIVEGGGGMPAPYYERGVAEAAAADVAVEPGTQDVGASLTVTFAIGG